jgi:ABC-type nitrate/sulfonate/bicarbonate transport system permease component
MTTGTSPRTERATRLLIDVGRSFPVIALLPVVILVLGATTQMKVTLIFIACVFPLVLQTTNGARRLEATLLSTVRSYRLPWQLRFRKVLLPQAAPFIATGLRIAITTAVLVAVGTEVLTQTQGLGRRITLAQSAGETALGYAYIFYAALLGVVINALANSMERRLIRWQRAEAE